MNFKGKIDEKLGITLISLAVTIIILLIIVGVSLSIIVGDEGVINRTIKAKEIYEDSSELEKIQLIVLSDEIEPNKIGQELKRIHFNTVEDTTSIYDIESGEAYSDDWYYITDNDVSDINLKNSYIVNYETNEIIKYDENKHRIISNNLLCIKEGLVYSVDAKNMSKGSNWGNAILHNFNEEDENSGWSENSLMFDGIDDGIEVPDNTDYSNGITLEMYFKYFGKLGNDIAQILMMKRTNPHNGFFMFLWNNDNAELAIDIGGTEERLNTRYYVSENEKIYVTYTYNPTLATNNGKLYINGQRMAVTKSGNIQNLISVQSDTNIQIGADIYETNHAGKYPFYGEIYAARVYNRPLAENEVKYNYDNTVENY